MKNYFYYLMTASLLFLALSCKKKDDVPIDGVTLNQGVAVLAPNETLTLTATFTPDKATDQTLFWESKNTAVAIVVDGVVTAKSEGKTEITVAAKNDIKATCYITVTSKQMILTKETSGTVTIELIGTGDMSVDWGDESDMETRTLSSSSIILTHSYSAAPSGAIKITGENITRMVCPNNRLTGLDVSNNSELTYLSCGNNRLETLIINGSDKLHTLYCYSNQLTSLNLNDYGTLNYLNCSDNNLTSLNLNGCVSLFYANCGGNMLSNLDVSECIILREFYCDNNQLMSLNMSDNILIYTLSCQKNKLSKIDLENLFGTLHGNTTEREKFVYIFDNPGTDSCNSSIAEGNEWTVQKTLKAHNED